MMSAISKIVRDMASIDPAVQWAGGLQKELSGNLQIVFGGADACMAHLHLNNAQVCAALKLMGGEGVAQGVRRDFFGDARFQSGLSQSLPGSIKTNSATFD